MEVSTAGPKVHVDGPQLINLGTANVEAAAAENAARNAQWFLRTQVKTRAVGCSTEHNTGCDCS